MIIPTTYEVTLLLMILAMLCWGSWANTYKLAGAKWRFELYYFDYALGVLVAAVIAAYTFGSMGVELSFQDNLLIAAKRKMAWAVAGGIVFNLANMLLVAAIAVAGLAVAFPVGIGLALVIGVIWNYYLKPAGNPMLLFSGMGLVVMAILVDALAYRGHSKRMEALAAAKAKEEAEAAALAAGDVEAPAAESASAALRRRRAAKTKEAASSSGASVKGILLSIISGVLMGSFFPMVEMAKFGDDGLGPYTVMVFFAAGVFCSTFLFNIYFMNLPVQGPAIGMFRYFQGTIGQHLLGLAGGIIWAAGALCSFVAASAPKDVNVGPAISYALGQGATLVSALWGLLVWKEFQGATGNVKLLLGLMLVLFALGLGAIAIAPLYGN
ncbi:MAG: hypothetical protein MUC42_02505 [Bryobacter sp.]|jgi:glucose uptake protein|nr:hypothetical protein [Bryobacter sp.]